MKTNCYCIIYNYTNYCTLHLQTCLNVDLCKVMSMAGNVMLYKTLKTAHKKCFDNLKILNNTLKKCR